MRSSFIRSFAAAFFFVAAFLAVYLTSSDIGITWDEPGYILQSKREVKWLGKALETLRGRGDGDVFSREGIAKYWPVWEGGQARMPGNETLLDRLNPPFSQFAAGIFALPFRGAYDPILVFRLFSAFCFSLIVVVIFLWVGEGAGKLGGGFAALAFFFLPRAFGHAHIAATDMPLTCLVFLSAFAFTRRGTRWHILSGIFFGLAISTKFTAFFLPVPFLLWGILYREKGFLNSLAWMVIVGVLVAFAVNPGLWHSPVEKLSLYFRLSLLRSHIIPISTLYLGRVYAYDLPWHHPWVMILATTPLFTAIAIVAGLFGLAGERFKDSGSGFFAIVSLSFMVSFMLPSSPGHDGIRLFLPALPFLAGLSGWGIKFILKRRDGGSRVKGRGVEYIVVGALLFPSAFGLAMSHPYELSYYSSLVGGIKGANRLGFETTYWLDVLNRDTLKEINAFLPRGARLFPLFPRYGCRHLEFLRDEGFLRSDIRITRQGADWYLFIGRQGLFSDFERLILDVGAPVWELKKRGVTFTGLYRKEGLMEGIYHRCSMELEINPGGATPHFRMGLFKETRKKWEEALGEYQNTLDIDPGYPRATLRKGVVLGQVGRVKEAAQTLMKALKEESRDAEVYVELGRLWRRAGETDKAREAYGKALEMEINNLDALRGLTEINSPKTR